MDVTVDAIFGTGEDTKGLLGKKVIARGESDFFNDGDQGTVVHIDRSGDLWADFGPDHFRKDSDGDAVWCLGQIEGEEYDLA